MDNISTHISYKEATESTTGTRFSIKNTPSQYQLDNMILLADKVFEPLREWASESIRVNSFFRSFALNKKVGGSKTSQHCADDGAAIDLSATGKKTNANLFNYIKDNLDFDQLIWEFGDSKNPQWVHVSYRKTGNRGQVLKATKSKTKTVYSTY